MWHPWCMLTRHRTNRSARRHWLWPVNPCTRITDPTKETEKVMSESVQMPALGESVTEGTVTQWLKSVGDEVEVDEPLLEVSTDKVDTEVPSPVAGTLLEVRAGEDDTVEVGGVLAIVGDQGAEIGRAHV